jgi:hypothetical protein
MARNLRRNIMQNLLRIVLIGAILWAGTLGADSSVVVDGRIDWVGQDHLMIGL